MKKRMLIILVVTLLFSLTFVTSALAGATTDVGNVPGFPAAGTINWTAWHSGSIVGGIPQQVMTEDSTNSSLGLNQGYSTFGGKLRWVLIVSNFSSPAAVSGSSTVTVLLGGWGSNPATFGRVVLCGILQPPARTMELRLSSAVQLPARRLHQPALLAEPRQSIGAGLGGIILCLPQPE